MGTFVPLGVGSRLVGADPAFLIQPYMAFLAVVLALGLWWLARPLVTRPWPRAGAVFLAAQPALLFGYYLWGGVKEVAAAAMIAAAAALAQLAAERPPDWRPVVPLAVVTAALIGGLSAGGLVWVAPVLVAALVILARGLTPAAAAVAGAGLLRRRRVPGASGDPPGRPAAADGVAAQRLRGEGEPDRAARPAPGGGNLAGRRLPPAAECRAALLRPRGACAGPGRDRRRLGVAPPRHGRLDARGRRRLRVRRAHGRRFALGRR